MPCDGGGSCAAAEVAESISNGSAVVDEVNALAVAGGREMAGRSSSSYRGRLRRV